MTFISMIFWLLIAGFVFYMGISRIYMGLNILKYNDFEIYSYAHKGVLFCYLALLGAIFITLNLGINMEICEQKEFQIYLKLSLISIGAIIVVVIIFKWFYSILPY